MTSTNFNSPAPLLRLPDVLNQRGIRKTQHYDDVKRGLFTQPVKIGKRASAWPSNEVAIINQARIAGQSESEIKELVAKLHERRSHGTANRLIGA